MKIIQRYKVGALVTLTADALENYREDQGKTYKIISVSKSSKDHRGFDESSNCALYDLEGLNFSLYDWELN